MKVKVLKQGATRVGEEYFALIEGKETTLPDGRAKQLIAAGIVEAVTEDDDEKPSRRGSKRVTAAPENKAAAEAGA